MRRLARSMLGIAAVAGGVAAMKDPGPRVAAARRLGVTDPERLARVDAGIQVGAGALLALGRLPRVAAALGTASLVPVTLGQGRFWAESDRGTRQLAANRFVSDLALSGGMLLAVAGRRRRRRRRAVKLPGTG